MIWEDPDQIGYWDGPPHGGYPDSPRHHEYFPDLASRRHLDEEHWGGLSADDRRMIEQAAINAHEGHHAGAERARELAGYGGLKPLSPLD